MESAYELCLWLMYETNIAGPLWRECRGPWTTSSMGVSTLTDYLVPQQLVSKLWKTHSSRDHNYAANPKVLLSSKPTQNSRVRQCERCQGIDSLARKSTMTTRLQRLSDWPVTKALSHNPPTNHNLHFHRSITANSFFCWRS